MTVGGRYADAHERVRYIVTVGSVLRRRYLAFIARHEVAWELTFAVLAIVYVAVGYAADDLAMPELATLDAVLTVVFVAEFSSRLLASLDRRSYLRGHWVDALALVPAVRGVRVLRLLRLLRLVRAFAGFARVLTRVERLAMHRGLVWVFAAWLAVMALCSLALYAAENGVNQAVSSPFDALWWGITTMTTVGYGDVYPVTPEGRLAAIVLMTLGIALFLLITATITSFMLESHEDPLDQLAKLGALRDRSLITEGEFQRKRDELASRL